MHQHDLRTQNNEEAYQQKWDCLRRAQSTAPLPITAKPRRWLSRIFAGVNAHNRKKRDSSRRIATPYCHQYHTHGIRTLSRLDALCGGTSPIFSPPSLPCFHRNGIDAFIQRMRNGILLRRTCRFARACVPKQEFWNEYLIQTVIPVKTGIQ